MILILVVKKKNKLDKVLMKKLNDDADKFIEQAAQNGVGVEEVRLLVVKAQSLTKSANGKEKLIADMSETMEKIEKELKAEAVAQRCSVKKVFLEISQNS